MIQCNKKLENQVLDHNSGSDRNDSPQMIGSNSKNDENQAKSKDL